LRRILLYVGGTIAAFAMISKVSTPAILPVAAAGFLFYIAACSVVGGIGHITPQPPESFRVALVRYRSTNLTELRWFVFLEAIGVIFALVGLRILVEVLPAQVVVAVVIGAALLAVIRWPPRRARVWLHVRTSFARRTQLRRRARRGLLVIAALAIAVIVGWCLISMLV
jgi:hypothetical protein